MRWLVRLYPRAWQERYGEEFAALLEQQPSTPRVVLDVLRAAVLVRASEVSEEGVVARFVPMLRVLSVVVLIQLVYWGALIVLRQPVMLERFGPAGYEAARDVLSVVSIMSALSVSYWMLPAEQRRGCWPFRRRAS